MEKIISQINEVLADEFEIEVDEIIPEANVRETLDLDSLDYVDLVVAIESICGVKLNEQDFERIETFENFYQVLQEKISEKEE